MNNRSPARKQELYRMMILSGVDPKSVFGKDATSRLAKSQSIMESNDLVGEVASRIFQAAQSQATELASQVNKAVSHDSIEAHAMQLCNAIVEQVKALIGQDFKSGM